MSQNKKNYPGLGIEFEVLLPAYFCLKLLENCDVEDFRVESNAKGFGNVDDLIFRIKRRHQSELCFALQLKHADSENSRLYPNNFWSADDCKKKKNRNSDFKIIKYAQTFSQFDAEKSKYHVILFTNKTFDPAKAGEVQNFTMQQHNSCKGRFYFDTADGKSIYKFSLKATSELPSNLSQSDFRNFFDKFSLYTSQCNSTNLEEKIKNIFVKNYHANEASAVLFTNFFRSWHKDEFKDKELSKKVVQVQLIQILLSNCIEHRFSITRKDSGILQTALNFFDIIHITSHDILHRRENEDVQGSNTLGLAKDLKIVKRKAKSLTPEEHCSALIYKLDKPAVVMLNEDNKNLIYAVLNKILRKNLEIPIKMVICGENIDVKQLDEFNIFGNLRDLYLKNENLFFEVLENFEVSLQGRGKIKMGQIVDEGVAEFVTVEDLLKSSNGGLIIGNGSGVAVENYVPRVLETVCISFDCIINLEQDLVVIDCGDGLEEVENKLQRSTKKKICKIDELKTASLEELNAEYKSAVILTHLEAEMEIFPEFQGSIHFLKALDEDCFQWISTRGDIGNLRSGCNSKIKEISEEDVCGIFKNNNVNVICAEPGMGKSVLMEVLKKHCPADRWAVKIDFRECSQIFKAFDKNGQWEDLFYKKIFEKDESIREKVEEIFLKRKKIYLFFDGLDELQSIYIETAIKFLETLISRGFKMWVSSRRNLQDLLETRLNVFALNIQELSEKTQKNYIKNRLSPFYESKEIQAITHKIFENAAVFNNHEILGIPLQLSMLTEILIQDRDLGREFNEKIFVMTEMFESFLEGKITHYLKKITSNPEMLVQDYKKFYSYFEIAALKSCLDDSFYKTLNIVESSEYREFIKTDPSRLGIITKITEDGVPVFQHNTYGEYFVACYFTKYYENISLERLFERKYSNIRLMFDIKLAEDSLPHLAVIYKDFDRLATFEDDISGVDKGGRNLLHLACCYYGEEFHFLDVDELLSDFCENSYRLFSSSPNKKLLLLDLEIIKFLQNKEINAYDTDKVFKWNCLQYCDAVLNLSTINTLLTDESVDLAVFEQSLKKYLANYESLFFYASKYNFKNIIIMLKRLFVVSSKIDAFASGLKLKIFPGETLLHVAARNGNVDMVELLLNEGVDVNAVNNFGATPLHTAISNNQQGVIHVLLSKEINVNAKNYEENTVLHLAVQRNNLKTVKMLLAQTQIDIEGRNKNGDTALLVAAALSNFDIFQFLLKQGADLRAINNHGETVLHLSAMSTRIRCCEFVFNLFSERNIDVNVKNFREQSVLHVGIIFDNLEVMKFLLSHEEIDLESRDDRGHTPLLVAAASCSDAAIFELLLERGADLNAIDNNGDTVLHLLATLKLEKSYNRLLRKYYFSVNGGSILRETFKHHNVTAVELSLARREINIDCRNKLGNTPLLVAAAFSYVDLFELLLKEGADLNVINNCGETVLHVSAKNGNTDVMDFILGLGFNVDAVDDHGHTYLFYVKNHLLFDFVLQ